MAKDIVNDDELDLDDIDDELDNDEGYDLDGDPDEDIDTDYDIEDEDDIEADDGEDELDETETDEDNDETDDEESETEDDGEKPDEDDSADESATDDKAEIARLRSQLAAKDGELQNVRSLSKETLQKMGIEVDGTVEEALEKANAESEGISLEDYRKGRAATAEAQAAEAQAKKQAFERLAASDLSELKKSFPDLLKTKHIADCFDKFEDFVQFGKLRDSGVEPKTAYLAVNGDKVRSQQAAAAQQKAASGNKQHLKSAVSKKAAGSDVEMPKEALKEWRDLFPNLSDKEIKALYKQSL